MAAREAFSRAASIAFSRPFGIILVVEMIEHQPRGGGGKAGRLFEIAEGRARHRLGGAESLQQGALSRRADAGDLVERIFCKFLLALGADACRWRSDAPRRAGAARNKARDRAAPAGTAPVPRRRNVSRPALRSAPLAMEATVTPVTPSSATTARVASNWPRPPSIRIRSGFRGKASGSRSSTCASSSPSSLTKREKRRDSTSRIMA